MIASLPLPSPEVYEPVNRRGISRQSLLQHRWKAEGKCVQCGKVKESDAAHLSRCIECTLRDRERKRKKLGYQDGSKTGMGRPPLV